MKSLILCLQKIGGLDLFLLTDILFPHNIWLFVFPGLGILLGFTELFISSIYLAAMFYYSFIKHEVIFCKHIYRHIMST